MIQDNHPVLAGLGILSIVLIVFAVMLVPKIFYLLTLQKALDRCSPASRAMSPGMVWLLLIPFFNLVWQFFVVLNMSKSLGAEFQRRGIPEEPDPGQTIGLVMCASSLLCGPIYLIFWIIYWVKVAGFSSKLAGAPMPATA
jgi:hypothetical protein